MSALNWDWTQMPPPSSGFQVGDRVVLVWTPRWTNTTIMHLVGRRGVVKVPKGGYMRDWPDNYGVEVEGFDHVIGVPAENMRRIDDPEDPFAEPRDMSDDTPNKRSDWYQCPWKPPLEVKP
jgi:hypothetical protein